MPDAHGPIRLPEMIPRDGSPPRFDITYSAFGQSLTVACARLSTVAGRDHRPGVSDNAHHVT